MKIKFDPIILFLFGLAVGVIISPLLRANFAHAETIYTSPNANVLVSFETLSNDVFYSYKNIAVDSLFPATTSINRIEIIKPIKIDGTAGSCGDIYVDSIQGFESNGLCVFSTGSYFDNVNDGLIFASPFVGQSHHDQYKFYVSNLFGVILNTDDTVLYNGFVQSRFCTENICTGTFDIPTVAEQINYSPDYNTRFTGVDYILATTTLNIDAGYFIDLTEINTKNPQRNPTDIIVKYASTTGQSIAERSFSILPISNGQATTSIYAENITDGTWDIYIGFYNLNTAFNATTPPFADTNIQFSITILGGIIVSSTTPEFYNGITNSNVDDIECSVTNISGCIIKTLSFLFVPSDSALNNFLSIGDELDTVKPFGYFTTALDVLSGIDLNGVEAYTMPEIPFSDTIFTPLKDGISVLLWGIFIFVFYNKRLKNIDL